MTTHIDETWAGGADEVDVSTANSAADNVFKGTNAAIKFDTAQAPPGASQSCRFTTGATSTTCDVREDFTDQAITYVSWWWQPTASLFDGGNWYIATTLSNSGTNDRAQVQVTQTVDGNVLRIRNNFVTVATMSVDLTEDTWYQLGWTINNTSSTQLLRVYDSAGNLLEEISGTYNRGNIGRCSIGNMGAGTNKTSWAGRWVVNDTGLVVPFATGTAYTQTLGGTVTASGTAVRACSKPLAGSCTSSGTAQKQTAKTVAGSVTSSGSIVQAAAKVVAGSVTATGVLVKACSQTLTGSTTVTGTAFKLVAKTLAGSSTASGTATKQTAQSVGGSVTASSVLTHLTAKTVTGTLTASGAIAKAVAQTTSGTLTPSGVIAKAVSKSLAGSVTPSGAIAKLVAKTFAGTVTAVGDVVAALAVDLGLGDAILRSLRWLARLNPLHWDDSLNAEHHRARLNDQHWDATLDAPHTRARLED